MVTNINYVGNVSDGITTFTISLRLPDDERLFIGMNGKVHFLINNINKSILLPLSLIMEDSDGEYVYVSPSGDSSGKDMIRKNIVTGTANDYYVQIVSGLDVGDVVLYEDTKALSDMSRESNENGQ